MLDFQEELKNFSPIKTVEEVGDAIEKEQEQNDLIDLLDIIKDKIKE